MKRGTASARTRTVLGDNLVDVFGFDGVHDPVCRTSDVMTIQHGCYAGILCGGPSVGWIQMHVKRRTRIRRTESIVVLRTIADIDPRRLISLGRI